MSGMALGPITGSVHLKRVSLVVSFRFLSLLLSLAASLATVSPCRTPRLQLNNPVKGWLFTTSRETLGSERKTMKGDPGLMSSPFSPRSDAQAKSRPSSSRLDTK